MHIYEHMTGYPSIYKCALAHLSFKYTTFSNARTLNTRRSNVIFQLRSQPLCKRLCH